MPGQVIQSEVNTIGCDGGDEAFGHPLVYLQLKPNLITTCPYCSRQFIFKKDTDLMESS